MLTLEGELQMATFAQHALRLSEVKREWLVEEPVRDSLQSVNTH